VRRPNCLRMQIYLTPLECYPNSKSQIADRFKIPRVQIQNVAGPARLVAPTSSESTGQQASLSVACPSRSRNRAIERSVCADAFLWPTKSLVTRQTLQVTSQSAGSKASKSTLRGRRSAPRKPEIRYIWRGILRQRPGQSPCPPVAKHKHAPGAGFLPRGPKKLKVVNQGDFSGSTKNADSAVRSGTIPEA
jgi:hypothetical protein